MPPFTPTIRPDVFLNVDDEPADAGDDRPFQREGLPPGFRMRHDAHYVDQLTSRAATPQLRVIPLRDIDAERTIDPHETQALARSIGRHGVLQPLLVRPRAGRFQLIAGARRLAAAGVAGLTEVPCVVHQVDDARARLLAEAEGLRHVDAIEASPAKADPSATWLAELWHSCSAIGSCLHLLGERDAALRDRVALDLVRTEVHRATRLVRSLTALTSETSLSTVDVSLATALDQALESFAAERRLSGVAITVERGEGPFELRADPDWLAAALSAAVGGMLALVQGARTPALAVRLARSASQASLTIEISQQSVNVPVWALPRFFDTAWTDRPGGYQAGIELAAARRLAERHGGGAEVVPAERGGCRLVLVFESA
jgi:signal transduction histidine kinase